LATLLVRQTILSDPIMVNSFGLYPNKVGFVKMVSN
jgi:hypothetical protein